MTGRGNDVDVRCFPALPIESAARSLREVRLWRYDAIVVTVGSEDARRLLPLSDWEQAMAALLRFLSKSSSASTRIVVAGVPTLAARRGFSPLTAITDLHVRRMNSISRRLVLDVPRAAYVGPPATSPHCPERPAGCPDSYEAWAKVIVPLLERPLPALSLVGAPSASRLRNRPDEENLRQRAVARLQPLRHSRDPELHRLASRACDVTGARYAAITVIDDDLQWNLAQVGFQGSDVERSISFCARTIRQSGALVVADARSDPRFSRNPLVEQGIVNFYAGFPIELSDGLRVGALCVFDEQPRDALQPAEEVVLRDLAKLVERVLPQLVESPRRSWTLRG